MTSLAEYQTHFRTSLLGDRSQQHLFASGTIDATDALAIYRGNVLAATANALRLSFPTVDRLVGETFFNQLCAKRLKLDPPTNGCLSDYCAAFPNFVREMGHLHGLSYLADSARFDLELERVANAAQTERSVRVALDDSTLLVFVPTLRVIALDFPADEIRTAIETDEESLARIDMTERTRWRALWRGPAGVELRTLSNGAGVFLAALIAGHDLAFALEQAELYGADDLGADIERDIIRAPFTRILAAREAQP